MDWIFHLLNGRFRCLLGINYWSLLFSAATKIESKVLKQLPESTANSNNDSNLTNINYLTLRLKQNNTMHYGKYFVYPLNMHHIKNNRVKCLLLLYHHIGSYLLSNVVMVAKTGISLL